MFSLAPCTLLYLACSSNRDFKQTNVDCFYSTYAPLLF